MLACPPQTTGQANFIVYLSVFYYILQYGLILSLAIRNTKNVYSTLDLLSITFLKAYVIFKVIFFSILINADMPTYVKWLDSKAISLTMTLLVLIFSIFLTFIRLKDDRL